MDEYQEYGKMSQFQQKLNSKLEHNARSVFVGNISYDVSEEEIKQLFSRVGSIVHFRLVHDRDTGRPKGFGFCEFTEPPMADAAIRHFQGYELHGRALRVDSASASERNVEETQQMQAAVQAAKEQYTRVEETQYGKETDRGKAPEAIAKTVSSLPPEQMFELMKQMKNTVTSNPSQLRQFLSENPQLAYALLQAQVVMRVVDPKVAYSMLHRETPVTQQPFHKMHGVANGGPPAYTGPPPSQYNPPMPAPRNYGGPPVSSAPLSRFPMPQSQPSPILPSASLHNAPGGSDDEQQQAQMLLRVMQLSADQIACLNPDDQEKSSAFRKMQSLVVSSLVFLLTVMVSTSEASPFPPHTSLVIQDTQLIRQFLDRYQPTVLVHPVVRRFDVQAEDLDDSDEHVSLRTMAKRNNAEVVNHILKNFGTLDRLGDVGK
ncbi:unnamed protein product [Bursaphelenchus okinawaensis]|uniref:RRM domain-containing protein n=1 Tax=Bursaphelenchus okinawaensis TaxID=465554 RepID=A0A811LQ80_9BILA|nr:unnamed protein product [Bursaphelenchus okinawaensis]CAG9126328.1 unnamed protein product [Bursaphelenchus okinawaensis]